MLKINFISQINFSELNPDPQVMIDHSLFQNQQLINVKSSATTITYQWHQLWQTLKSLVPQFSSWLDMCRCQRAQSRQIVGTKFYSINRWMNKAGRIAQWVSHPWARWFLDCAVGEHWQCTGAVWRGHASPRWCREVEWWTPVTRLSRHRCQQPGLCTQNSPLGPAGCW